MSKLGRWAHSVSLISDEKGEIDNGKQGRRRKI